MPNRDHEDSQYNRYEGRFESRDDRSWQDQGNRGSRDWERRGDDYRRDFGGQGRGFGEPARGSREFDESYGSSRYAGDHERNYGQQGGFGQQGGRGSLQSPNWYDERREAARFGQQDWNRGGQGEGSYGHQGFGQQGYGQPGNYGQEWTRSLGGGGFNRPDFSRVQSNYGARDAFRTQAGEGAGFGRGDFGRGERHEDESFGQQLRHAGQQMARSVKRVFRGPKGYKRSDDRIREDVSDRLALQDDVDPSDIEVSVSNGEVTLTGTVQSRHEKFLAEEIADAVSGVNDVHNQLRVRRDEGQAFAGATGSSTAAASVGLSAENSAGMGSAGASAENAMRNRNARA